MEDPNIYTSSSFFLNVFNENFPNSVFSMPRIVVNKIKALSTRRSCVFVKQWILLPVCEKMADQENGWMADGWTDGGRKERMKFISTQTNNAEHYN